MAQRRGQKGAHGSRSGGADPAPNIHARFAAHGAAAQRDAARITATGNALNRAKKARGPEGVHLRP